ncbi:SAM-dependent methyltransferase [Nocardia nova]|uniref:class I SAM-dependent methyltransferase n=1 Tax=Nocardia nova TaxID=37330 RepID=UPI001C470D02|nr:SAM-dependent methyltransferase [Nocardia nova]MBV7708171.1 SAM-dependent methyltransferase [Nocardia nova]
MTSGNNAGWDINSSVGLTAVAVAAARAIETSSVEPVIQDPYAERFVKATGLDSRFPLSLPPSGTDTAQNVEDYALWRGLTDCVAMRTNLIDKYLRDGIRDGIRQFVILGSGLDARSHRIEWPADAVVVEIDQPGVIEFKKTVLPSEGSRTGVRYIGADLRETALRLVLEGHLDRDRPVTWILEGLLTYLTADEQLDLIAQIAELSSDSGSQIIADQAIKVDSMREDETVRKLGSEFDVDPSEVVPAGRRPKIGEYLEQSGWRYQETRLVAELNAIGRNEDYASLPLGADTFVVNAYR